MISFKQIRKWHKWPGILFLFPAFLISITAILLALDGVLHLDRVKTNIPTMATTANLPEVKAIYVNDETHYIGTKSGLFMVTGDNCAIVPELSGCDIKGLLPVGDTLFVASKQGVWKLTPNKTICIFKNDVQSISLAAENLLAVSMGKKGFQLVDFYGNEKKEAGQITLKAQTALSELVAKQPQTLHKLIIDLHTGEAIVGKTLKPYWIAFSGIQLLLLTLTGLYFVVKKKKPKSQKPGDC